jgi:hypothetical protein
MIDFNKTTIRQSITPRGGGIEIDLTDLGFEGEKMTAYQDYLGGGMLGRIGATDTIRTSTPFVEESICRKLDEISDKLKQHFFEKMFGEFDIDEFNSLQRRRLSGY